MTTNTTVESARSAVKAREDARVAGLNAELRLLQVQAQDLAVLAGLCVDADTAIMDGESLMKRATSVNHTMTRILHLVRARED